jgi:hypothetical protein
MAKYLADWPNCLVKFVVISKIQHIVLLYSYLLDSFSHQNNFSL